MRRIGLAMEQYFWHCGGYVKDGGKFLVCSLVRYEPRDLERLRQKSFPGIKDGGTSASGMERRDASAMVEACGIFRAWGQRV